MTGMKIICAETSAIEINPYYLLRIYTKENCCGNALLDCIISCKSETDKGKERQTDDEKMSERKREPKRKRKRKTEKQRKE